MATTANFGWTKPTVGGDNGAWGTIANTLYDAVDAALSAVKTTADAALSRAGGLMTGRLDAKTATLAKLPLGAVSGSPVNLDCSAAQYITLTIAGASTLIMQNVPNVANTLFGVILKMVNGGSAALTWPANTKWPSGSAPALTAAGTDLIALFTDDVGATWQAFVIAKDVR